MGVPCHGLVWGCCIVFFVVVGAFAWMVAFTTWGFAWVGDLIERWSVVVGLGGQHICAGALPGSGRFVSVTSSAGAWRLVSVEWLVSVVVLAAQ